MLSLLMSRAALSWEGKVLKPTAIRKSQRCGQSCKAQTVLCQQHSSSASPANNLRGAAGQLLGCPCWGRTLHTKWQISLPWPTAFDFSHRASPEHGQRAVWRMLMDLRTLGLVLCTASPTAAVLMFFVLLSTNPPRARGMFNSSITWLWLYSALEGNYCDLENCNSYTGSDIRQSNKALLIIVINGAVSKVLPITQHMSLRAHRHKHQENSFQLNLSLLPGTTIILISWYCR